MVFRFARRHPFLTGLALAGVAAGSLTESRIDPVAWHPPDPPEMTGPLAENRELVGADRVVTVEGPEDVAFDDEGRLYTGAENGIVYRTKESVDADATDAKVEAFASLEGRPLAMTFDGEDLLVCAIGTGLHRITPEGESETLTDRAGNRSIVFADDLYVHDDGTVYFTDASRHDLFQAELFELRDTGRLLAYHPGSGDTTVELDGLGFANGVALGPEGESLLVNETSRYRITRYWFDGEREGRSEVFAENLPGYPDNVDRDPDGEHYWVAIPAQRDPALERLQRSAWLKRQLGKLPEAAIERLGGDPYGLVLKLDADGSIVDSVHDPTGRVHGVTSATPHEGALYLGTLFGESVFRYPLD